MDDQNKNLIIASVLSFIVIVVWFLLFPPADQVQPTTPEAVTQQVEGMLPPPTAEPGAAPGTSAQATPEAAPRLAIETPRLAGSVSLVGAGSTIWN